MPRMAVDIPEITDSNHTVLDHIRADMCETLRIVTRLEREFEQFRPLLDQFRAPLATMITRRARRNNGRD